jgi:hypothetical protein
VGFSEAIERSGWDTRRQQDARSLCTDLRKALLRADYTPDDQVYRNLDADPLIPDTPRPHRAASRRALLGELLKRDGHVKSVANDFCHNHKMEGPEDKRAPAHTLGRVWTFGALHRVLKSQSSGVGRSSGGEHLLRTSIRSDSLDDQQAELELTECWLGEEKVPMWAFYDPSSPDNPLRNLTDGRAAVVDRLGLGMYDENEALVQWGHRLSPGKEARTPTAWDGGVRNPHWRPGGRTFPLSAAGSGTGRFKSTDGLPEVVHTPVRGRDLAIRISFVAD